LNGSQCLLLQLLKRRQWSCCFDIEWRECALFSYREEEEEEEEEEVVFFIGWKPIFIASIIE
jgi:hypothetical protein